MFNKNKNYFFDMIISSTSSVVILISFLLFPLFIIVGMILEMFNFISLDGFMTSQEDDIIDEERWTYT